MNYSKLILSNIASQDLPSVNFSKTQFKEEIVEAIRDRNIYLPGFEMYPNAGIHKKAKLIELDPVQLDEQSAERIWEKYKILDPFIEIVGTVIRKYHNAGRFK